MSDKHYAAAVDLGATSGRIIVGAFSDKGLELTEVHRFPNGFNELNGYAYWDIGSLFAQVKKGLSEAKRQFPAVNVVGVDTWGVDYVMLDKNGRMAFPMHAYRDRRTEPIVKEIEEKGDDRKLFDWTGLPMVPYNSGIQLCETIRAFPQLRDLVEHVLFLPDYLNYLLSGQMANEFSISSTTQLLQAQGDSFSKEALDYFGIPEKWFKTPTKSGKLMGSVKEMEGVDLALVPGHDTSCAYEAIPRIGSDLFASAGTWLLAGGLTKRPALGDEAFAFGVNNERAGDGGYRPNKILLGLWLLEQVLPYFNKRPKNASEWSALIDAAENEPEASTLINTNDKALFNPKNMQEAITTNLKAQGSEAPTTLPAMTRLICDSLGQSMASAAQRFASMTGETPDNIIVVGGGSKNRLLCQRMADFSGLTVTSYDLEGTSVGNLGYQYMAKGVVSSMDEFRDVVRKGLAQKSFQPRGR